MRLSLVFIWDGLATELRLFLSKRSRLKLPYRTCAILLGCGFGNLAVGDTELAYAWASLLNLLKKRVSVLGV